MHKTGLRAVHMPNPSEQPVVIGHRGAPSHRPEHTLASYELAIDLGADRIEPDVVVSRDGVLIARHENELSLSTDVAERPEFADRRRTQQVDFKEMTGWFTEDFTLAELRTLRAVERMPAMRPLNTAYDGHFGILTLAEVISLARRRSTRHRPIKVQAELKFPSWWESKGFPMVELVTAELRRQGAAGHDGPVVIQTFDASALRALHTALGARGTRLVQLISDLPRHDHMVTPAGLREISTYAEGIGPGMARILLRGEDESLIGVSDLIGQAHRAGLQVNVWTLRGENAFLPLHLRRGADPTAPGDVQTASRLLFALGVDGVITDSPECAFRARAELSAPARTRN
jgi:glycerophosphoryl diester phosphodiesterase